MKNYCQALILVRDKMQHIIQRHKPSHQGNLLFFGIMIPLLVMDWNYSRPGFTLPLMLSYPGWLAGLCFPMIYFIWTRFAFSSDARAMFNRFLFLILYIVLVLTAQRLFRPEAAATYSQFIILEFVALPLWGIAGFLYASQSDAIQMLLGRFALFAAWGSFFSFTLRLAGMPASIPFGVAGGPTRLFFLFGFCWYLARFLADERTSRRALAGLVACSLEVVITLHKPIIWATIFSVATLVLTFRAHLPRHQFGKTMTTLLKSTIVAMLVLVTVNSIFQGVISKEINQFISVRVLHQSEEENAITIGRTAGGRFEIWEIALKDFNESPWVGSGVKDFETETGSISLHNGYLDLLFIVGICGIIPVVYGIGLWLGRVMRSLNCAPLLLVQSSCLAYVVGILMFNAGGTSRLFPGASYFIALICGISLRLAVDSLPQTINAESHLNTSSDNRFADNRGAA